MAGEGSFGITSIPEPRQDGTQRLKFTFSVTMADRDRPLLEALQLFLRVGSINDRPQRNGWLPQSTFSVRSHLAHNRVTIPFVDEFLLPSAKRNQFEQWREAFLAYEVAHPSKWGRGRSTCSEPDCDKPVRGRGLCRSHYYRVTGY